MSRGCTRTRIPASFGRPEGWQTPMISHLTEEDQEVYRRRERALRMYASGVDFVAIKAESGLGRREVFRLLKRFTAPNPAGGIYGLFGLFPKLRIKRYQRTKPMDQLPGSSAGFAGAMGNLLEQHAEVEGFLCRLLFGSEEYAIEPTPSFRSVHASWLEQLQKLGVSRLDWPFCCGDKGYSTLVRYCNDLIAQNADRSAGRRYGRAMANRLAKVGKGVPRLIQPLRPGTFAILDYGKADAASCFTFETPEHKTLEQVLPRWYIAVLIDEYTSGTWSAFNTMESEPSADSVLEALDRALRPENYSEKAARDGAPHAPVHIHELLPEFGFSGVSVLKVDNARCNKALEVVDQIVHTLGCAVNLGPCYTWVRRNVVEQVIGRLAASGAKRLPSSYGTGPTDPLRDNPLEKARLLHFDCSDLDHLLHHCCRAHNRNPTERLHWCSPVEYISRAMADPQSGVFSKPLPQRVLTDPELLDHVVERIVRGSLKKGERPYVRWGRCRYTSPALASAWHLLGKAVLLRIKRYDARQVIAVLPDTGEKLGRLIPERVWREHAISLRMRQLINRAGLRLAANEHEDPLRTWQKEREDARRTSNGKSQKGSSRDALRVAREQRLRAVHPDARSEDVGVEQSPHAAAGFHADEPAIDTGLDPLGLDEIPSCDTERGRS